MTAHFASEEKSETRQVLLIGAGGDDETVGVDVFQASMLWGSELADTAELVVVVLSGEDVIQYVSPFCANLLGLKDSDLIGATFMGNRVCDRDRSRAYAHFHTRAGEADGANLIVPLLTAEGGEIAVRWARTLRWKTPFGQEVRVATGIDVSQRIAQESLIAAERGRLAEAQRIARIGSWELDLVTDELQWSDQVYRIFEVDPGGVVPSYPAFLSMIHPDDRLSVDQAYRLSLEKREPYRIIHRISLQDGRTKWVEEQCETVFDANGKPLLSRGTVQDITEVRLAQESARSHEEMVSSFLRVSPEAVFVTDKRGLIRTFSEGAERIFRGRRDAVIGRSIDLLMPDRFHAKHRAHLERFEASAKSAIRMAERSEIRARRLTGEEFAAEASVSKVPTPEGELFAVVLRDLSERKAYEAALRSSKVRAEAATEAKSAFLAMMSHEIRTPMNGVLGMLSVLALEDLRPAHREMVDHAMEAGTSLMEILNDILDYSRIEARQVKLEMTRFDWRKVLRKTHSLHALKAESGRISLETHVDPSVPDVLVGDPARLQQILHNLIGNAVKFTKIGGVTVRSRYHRRSDDDGILTIEVEDTGIGMTAEQASVVFDRFTQADSSITRRFGGSGLGLSIVKGLVDAMDGHIALTSAIGKGTCFTLTLPMQVREAKSASRGFRGKRGGSRRPLKVLVAEDNVLSADTLKLLLDRTGITVTVARDGEEALKCFELGRFDLIFMDIHMPVLDGESALRVIRQLELGASTRCATVIACTAFVDPDRIVRYRELGFDDVLPKPVDPERLYQLVAIAEKRADDTDTWELAD